jgi:DNA-binding MarR family transcriptional regulator
MFLLTLAQRRAQQWVEADRHGVSPSQAGVLFLLRSPDGMLIGDVARTLGVGPSGMSGLIDRMEAAGLVRRVTEPDDRRAVRLKLTDSGVAARERARTVAADLNARLSQGFSEEELDVVSRWLTAVSNRMTQENQA